MELFYIAVVYKFASTEGTSIIKTGILRTESGGQAK
jgi:hypothetical protein